MISSVGTDRALVKGAAVGRDGALPHALKLFALWICGITGLSCAYNLFCAYVLHRSYPWTTPMIVPTPWFGDLVDYLPHFAYVHSAAFLAQRNPPLDYPAPGCMIYEVFYLAGRAAVPLFIILLAATALVATVAAARKLEAEGLARRWAVGLSVLLLVTSYPLALETMTGNVELFIWMMTMGALWAYCTGRYALSASIFALAIACKTFPVVYLALFFDRKRWKYIPLSLGIAAAVTVTSLWVLCPDVPRAFHQTQQNMADFVRECALVFLGGQIGFDHSFYALLKSVLAPIQGKAEVTSQMGFLRGWLLFTAVVSAVLWFTRLRRSSLVEKVIFLSVAAVALPPNSSDYTLLHLYAPWLLLAIVIVRGARLSRTGYFVLGCFAVVFTAQGFLIAYQVHVAAQFKALALLGLYFAAAVGTRVVPGAGDSPRWLDEEYLQ